MNPPAQVRGERWSVPAEAGSRGPGGAAVVASARPHGAGPSADSMDALRRELDTPLGMAVIAGSLHADRLRLLAAHLGGRIDGRAEEMLAGLDGSCRLLGDSLDHAMRVLRAPQRGHREHANGAKDGTTLAMLLHEALRDPLARFADRGLRCELRIDATLRTPGSAAAWNKVLSQLVENSVLHGFAGREAGQICISAESHGPGVLRVTYRDDGVGFSPEARQHALRRRYTSQPVLGCSGLGLCLLRDIVQSRLSGAIELQDTPSGAAFAIDVPAALSRQHRAAHPFFHTPPDRHRLRPPGAPPCSNVLSSRPMPPPPRAPARSTTSS